MRTRLSLQLALGCLLALAACSGDDKKENTADAGTNDAGGSAAGGGAKGTGSGKEGVDCESHANCASGLSCLRADDQVKDLKVCARPCLKASDCKDGERCTSATGEPEHAFCWNTEDEALKSCGPAFTALCDQTKKLGCLFFEDNEGSASGGVCLTPCKLKQDDACSDGFSCLDILDQPESGLCVHTVGRGEVCDEPKGEFCQPGNLCLKDGVSWRCYQDCSESKKCDDDKKCTELQDDQGAYCE